MTRRWPEETIAFDLRDSLARALGGAVELAVAGSGVHWNVTARAGVRSCRIDCFHYDPDASALMLGVQGNPHLSKVRAGPAAPVRVGAEYALSLRAGDVEVATGRTQRLDEAAHAVRDWLLAGCDLGAMYAAHVFVDQHLRALGSMSERVDRELAMLGSALRVAPDEDWAGRELTEAWIYDGPRSCWLAPGAGERLSLALLLHRTQIAQVEDLEVEIAARAIASWFGPDGSVAAVQRVAPRCEPARFAAAFERGDYLAWHWGNVLEEADSSSVLALHRPLLDRIATSDVARRFYSFTSLNRLCFSRCSLYPFDTDGLPMVHPVRDGRDVVYVIGVGDAERGRGDAREALACIERVLAAEPQPAYFGNIDDRTCDEVNAALAARGSHLRARREQHRQWMRIAVRAADGGWCEIKTERRGHLSMVPRDRDGARPADAPRVEGDTSAIVDAMERWLTSTGRPA